MHAADVLDLAAGLIDKHGMARKTYENTYGQFCSVGAIRQVLYGKTLWQSARTDPTYDQALKALAHSMSDQFGPCCNEMAYRDHYHTVTCINDERATKDDVVACMQKAAVNLRDG